MRKLKAIQDVKEAQTMQELTIEKSIELKLTPIDCVKYYDQNLSDKEAEYILWNETCFPFSNEIFLKQLYNIFNAKPLITSYDRPSQ